MKTIIIAGGSGTRLWPLSTSTFPKHLLYLTGERTMLQQAYDRAATFSDEIYVVTEASHADHVKEQLRGLDERHFLIEPGRRGTAHCILFALDYVSRHHDHTEPIAFIHADHHIRDLNGFKKSFSVAAKVAKARRSITLIGIEPTFPATGFGYIQRGDELESNSGSYSVLSFKEKPDYDTALSYVESGNYLWNCGYFVSTVEIFLQEIAQCSPELQRSYEVLSSIEDFNSDSYKTAYLEFDNQVIDIALIEKARDLAVVSANFDWMDVGSFKDLHDAVVKDEAGNYFRGEGINPIEVENVYVRNEEQKPIAVIGLDNIVVVNTPEGILVARKDISHRTGEIAKKLQKS